MLQNGVLNNVSTNRLKTAQLPLFHTDDSLQSSTRKTTEFTDDADLFSDDPSSAQSPQLSDVDLFFRRSKVGRVIRPPAILNL